MGKQIQAYKQAHMYKSTDKKYRCTVRCVYTTCAHTFMHTYPCNLSLSHTNMHNDAHTKTHLAKCLLFINKIWGNSLQLDTDGHARDWRQSNRPMTDHGCKALTDAAAESCACVLCKVMHAQNTILIKPLCVQNVNSLCWVLLQPLNLNQKAVGDDEICSGMINSDNSWLQYKQYLLLVAIATRSNELTTGAK